MCFYAIAKYLLFAFNFLFWCAGAAVCGIGIWLQVDQSALSDLDITIYGSGPVVFIVAGAVMLVFGFFGCCGAIKESTCLLGTYFTMLVIIFGLEVGIGAYAFTKYDSVEDATYSATYTLFTDAQKYDSDFAESIQQRFKCCGSKFNSTVDGYACAVYKTPVTSSMSLDSCGCDELEEGVCAPAASVQADCGKPNDSTITNVYIQDCGEELTQFTEDNVQIIATVGLSIGLAEVIGMFISMCLCCKVKNKGETV